jgi:hypothetical protein
MPMQAESLEVLEKASVAPAQARAIVRAIEIEIGGAKDTLATKHDVLELRSEIKQATAELRVEIARRVGGVIRQMHLAILGQMAVLLGFAYFFATHLR